MFLITFTALCWTCFGVSLSLMLRSPALDQALQMCLTSVEQKERITSLNLPDMVCLLQPEGSSQPSLLQEYIVHGQLLVHQYYKTFSAVLFPSWLPLACSDV